MLILLVIILAHFTSLLCGKMLSTVESMCFSYSKMLINGEKNYPIEVHFSFQSMVKAKRTYTFLF